MELEQVQGFPAGRGGIHSTLLHGHPAGSSLISG